MKKMKSDWEQSRMMNCLAMAPDDLGEGHSATTKSLKTRSGMRSYNQVAIKKSTGQNSQLLSRPGEGKIGKEEEKKKREEEERKKLEIKNNRREKLILNNCSRRFS